jgi:tight adherence protein B
MNPDQMLIVLAVVVAVSATLVAWFVIDTGMVTLQRYKANFTEKAKFQFQEFFLFIDPRKLFAVNLALMALAAVVAWLVTGSLIATLPALVLIGLMPRMIYAFMRNRRLKKFEEQLPDALMTLAGGLRAGVGISSAMMQLVSEAQAPLSQEFSLLLREQRLGVTMEQSLNNLTRRMPTPSTVLVVSAMRIAGQTGGGLAETLERTAHTIRSRMQMEGKIDALTAQGKMQAVVVGLLPIFLMLVLNHMEPEAMSLMWSSPIGWATLAVLAFLELMGLYVIKKIVTIDV